MQKLTSALLVVAVLAACAHTGNDGQVVIADGLRFALRSPASFGQQVLLVQAATLSFGAESNEGSNEGRNEGSNEASNEENQALLFHTEITTRSVAIVGSLPNGARLFSIVWDGSTLQSEGYDEALASIPPAYFIADLQIAQWPLAEVRAGFAESGGCFREGGSCRLTESADGLQRVLSSAEEVVVSVGYSGVPHHQYDTLYEHQGRGYRLSIETLDVQTLEDEQ